MNKRTIIYCSLLVAVLLVAAVAGFLFLSSGNERGMAHVRSEDELSLSFSAVPSDAVMVLEFEDFEKCHEAFSRNMMPPAVFTGGSFLPDVIKALPGKLEALSGASAAEELLKSDMAVSLHYSGHNRISPLAVISSPDQELAGMILDAVQAISRDCVAETVGGTVILTDSDVLASSSSRHLSEGVSILDNDDFLEIALASEGGVNLYVCHPNLGKLFSGCFNSRYLGYASFFQTFSYWSSYTVESAGEGFMKISGFDMHNVAEDEYSHVFEGLPSRASSLHSMTPYYASLALSVPASDFESLVRNIDRYRDGQGRLGDVALKRKSLGKAEGVSPDEWIKALSVKEVGVIRFETGGKQEFVNMIRCGNPAAVCDTSVLKKYEYGGFMASLFGSVFSFADEDYCTSLSGWLIIGSENAVKDFLSGRALELDLGRYLSDAGIQDVLPQKSLLNVYVNLAADSQGLSAPFKKSLAGSIASSSSGCTVDAWVYYLASKRKSVKPFVSIRRSDYEIPSVSKFERDTVVEIPKGPWKVKNCGTGRMNLMYQQDNMYICLTEEDGKGIWSAPFSTPICGNIGQVDYFENGKLQMIFASGSKLYLIDRLGRMVNPFPVDLGKEILLGPDVYDFNQNRKYNVMVLHSDNTLGLYDLKGRLRDDWVGFKTDETIKSLPEPLEINSSLYWVVTTSMQTVICDFTGRPVADFSGSKKLRPGAEIKPYSGNSVEIETYDGKKWVLDLKNGSFTRK